MPPRRYAGLLGAGLLATTLALTPLAGTTTEVAEAAVLPYRDATRPVADRVADLLARMTLDEKAGQMTQAERLHLTPGDLSTHGVGSVLSGGGSAPTPNTAAAWSSMTAELQAGALRSRLGIPMIYGIDAVHGHNNVRGATIFPHNIGLGATRNPGLVERIGRATAEEVAGTGIRWDFAPCVCVARDDRWGRTYESFGETPELAGSMTTMVKGLQTSSLADPGAVLATAKHYLGDGGTTGGKDQGNTELSESELRRIHLPAFRAAVRADVATVMPSYSSWNGLKMHANRYLLTTVLKEELGFDGFVVSDWEAIDQIDGDSSDFTAAEVATSINAGVDMIMVPDDWRRFIADVKIGVTGGTISMARIDDANRRILTKKFELGLFEQPYADPDLTSSVGSRAHRELARQAVRESLVLLKNKHDRVLPLAKTTGKVFVAGKSADNIGFQSGGWTIDWQGGDGAITPGTTILQGIRDTVSPSTTVSYDRGAQGIDTSYNAAVVVVGETPYAEFRGDRPHGLTLDDEDRSTIARVRATGVPLIVVLVSGRPLDIADEIGGWDAAVAAWLPGTEGQGVADVLFGSAPPVGKLPVTWPVNAAQEPINVGDGKVGLFPFGHGKTYGSPQDAYDYIGSAYFDDQSGTRIEACTDTGCGQNLGYLARGDYAGYAEVDFGSTPASGVETRIASGSGSGGRIEYRLDSPTGEVVARVPVSSTGGWQSWRTDVSPTTPVTGRHRVYQVFTSGAGDDFVNVNWFRFRR